jgi:hypothetical protein
MEELINLSMNSPVDQCFNIQLFYHRLCLTFKTSGEFHELLGAKIAAEFACAASIENLFTKMILIAVRQFPFMPANLFLMSEQKATANESRRCFKSKQQLEVNSFTPASPHSAVFLMNFLSFFQGEM